MIAATGKTHSIRTLLFLVVVGPMFIAALLVGLIDWANSRVVIAESSDRLFEQSSQALAERLSGLLSSAAMIDRVNFEALRSGDIEMGDIHGIEDHVLALLRSNPAVSSVYIASPEGGLVDAGREGPGGAEYIIETPNFAAGTFTKYSIDAEGRKTGILARIPEFDARARPWYVGAVARKGLVWTDIFPLFTGQDSTISAAQPVYLKDGKLSAVVSVDLFVSQIASFVREISAAEEGISFIINRDGLLVASPTDPAVFVKASPEGQVRRLPAAESVDPRIARAAAALEAERVTGPSGKPYVTCKIGTELFYAYAAPLDDPQGRGWRIVSVYPESLILGGLNRMRDVTILSMLFGIVLLVFLSFLMTSYFAIKVRHFSAFAAAVAQGRRDDEAVPPPSSIREIAAFRDDLLGMREKLVADFAALEEEVERRRRSEIALEESQRAYDRLTGHIPVGVYRATSNPDGGFHYDYVSERYLRIYGFRPGVTLVDNGPEVVLIHSDDRAAFLAEQARARATATAFAWEGRILVEGRLRRVRKESTPTLLPNGDILWDGMLTDITEAWIAGERIRSLLAEKELLLHEVHHRIKNNMLSMISLLVLQAEASGEPAVREALGDAEARLGSMMLLYDKLYRSESVTSMDASVYLADIADSIVAHNELPLGERRQPAGGLDVRADHPGRIRVEKNLQSIFLDASVLMPLGIIANELITNAYKYAFPEGREGKILVELSANSGRARLVVEDDGIGFEALGQDQGFGHLVIEGLVAQLGGKLEKNHGQGARFEIDFPLAG